MRDLSSFADKLDRIGAQIDRMERMLSTLIAALAEDADPDDEDLKTLEGERMGGARDQSQSLG